MEYIVQPFAGELEMGNMRPSLKAVGRTFKSNFVPFACETVSRQAFADLCAAGEVDFSPPLFVLFSRTGFLSELREHAVRKSDLILVNENNASYHAVLFMG